MFDKRFFYSCVTLFFILIPLIIWMIVRDVMFYKIGYKKTFENKFKGSIADIESDKSTVTLKLKDGKSYIFVQSAESALKNDIMKVANYGDSAVKKAFSNEITIMHGEKTFRINIDHH